MSCPSNPPPISFAKPPKKCVSKKQSVCNLVISSSRLVLLQVFWAISQQFVKIKVTIIFSKLMGVLKTNAFFWCWMKEGVVVKWLKNDITQSFHISQLVYEHTINMCYKNYRDKKKYDRRHVHEDSISYKSFQKNVGFFFAELKPHNGMALIKNAITMCSGWFFRLKKKNHDVEGNVDFAIR